MCRIYLLALALVVVSVAPASARTTIIEPPHSRWPYQQMVDRAYVPTPSVTLTVVEGLAGNPCGVTAQGCTDLHSIWIPRINRSEAKWILYHELGHTDDVYRLSSEARESIARLLGEPVWVPGYNELFADSFGFCAEKAHITQWWIEGMSRLTLRHICGIIRHSAPAVQPLPPEPAAPFPEAPPVYEPAGKHRP